LKVEGDFLIKWSDGDFLKIKRSDTLGISAIQANIMKWSLPSCSTL
jgi:hypothetical protein